MSLIWIVNILSVFFLCVFFAGIVIPQILLIAFRSSVAELRVYLNNHKQIYKNEQQFSISCMGPI